MKKLKKLSVLVLLAAGFALAFSGCSNTKDETGTEQGGEAGSGGETGGTGGSNDGTEKPGDSGSSGDNTGSNGDATGSGGNNSSGGQTGGDSTGSGGDNSNGGQTGGDTSGSGGGNNSGNTAKAGIIIGDTVYKFADLTIKDAYCGTYDGKNDVVAEGGELIISISEDGVLTMAGYSWDKTYLTFSQAVDLSSFSKMTIEAKVSDGYEAGDAVIFEVSSGDEAASGVNTWTDATFFGDLTTSFKSISIGMDKFSNLGENSVYGTDKADMKAIKEIAINPRSASGNIYIKSIKFE